MFKNSFKRVLKFILVMFFGFWFSTSASATIDETGALIDNNTFDSAYSLGYWQYHPSIICRLPADKKEAFFQFRINRGDRVYARVALEQELMSTGMSIQIFNTNRLPIGEPSILVANPTSLIPFIFANIDGTSNSETLYIKVTRGNSVGDILFPVRVENRISTGLKTFDFVGTVSNPGNPNILTNPSGVDSSVIYMDLTNNSTIPNRAIVKSITTASSITPSIRGITHKILSPQTNIWYSSIVSSATYGAYSLTTANNLAVARKWAFKYNATATSPSKISNVKATINYEYDLTNQFIF